MRLKGLGKPWMLSRAQDFVVAEHVGLLRSLDAPFVLNTKSWRTL